LANYTRYESLAKDLQPELKTLFPQVAQLSLSNVNEGQPTRQSRKDISSRRGQQQVENRRIEPRYPPAMAQEPV
jgi:hypothetical protein